MEQKRPTEAFGLPAVDGCIDFAEVSARIRKAEAGNKVDDLADALSEAVFAGNVGQEAVPCLIEAVGYAGSDLSLRSAALALASVASTNDQEVTGALIASFNRVSHHPFLAPSVLEALGLLALRDPLARAQLSALLFPLRMTEPRYLLIKAAKLIGLLDGVRPDPDLRAKLDELTKVSDLAVQAEARQQLALATLADALLADDRGALQERLICARAAFARAAQSEEHRPDAAIFVHTLDMLLAFPELRAWDGYAATQIEDLAKSVDHALNSLAPHDWHGYRSDRATRSAQRVLHICDALRHAAAAASVAAEWLDYTAALRELASLHAQVRSTASSDPRDGRIAAALATTADTIFAASLGPLLARVVQRHRLALITSKHEISNGVDDVYLGLRALEQAAAKFEFMEDSSISAEQKSKIIVLGERAGLQPDVLVKQLLDAIEEGSVERWAEKSGLAPAALPVEKIDLYGDDPAVDEVVRPLLHQIRKEIATFPLPKWRRASRRSRRFSAVCQLRA